MNNAYDGGGYVDDGDEDDDDILVSNVNDESAALVMADMINDTFMALYGACGMHMGGSC